jgi:hypothetical protein
MTNHLWRSTRNNLPSAVGCPRPAPWPLASGESVVAMAVLAVAASMLGGCASAPGAGSAGGSAPGAAVTAPAGLTLAQARAALPPEPPECLSPKIRKPEPMPVNAIPEAVLRQARSGWSVVRYDLVDGRVRNLAVVASQPAGLYDPYALAHAARYVDTSGAQAKGCYMTVEIKF